MKSLAFIHPFLYRYRRGIERFTVNLTSALAELGNDVEILTWRWPEPVHWPDLHPNVRVVSFPTPHY